MNNKVKVGKETHSIKRAKEDEASYFYFPHIVSRMKAGWVRLLLSMNKFSEHVKKDPENWPLVVITLGVGVWGVMLVGSKYLEYNPEHKRP